MNHVTIIGKMALFKKEGIQTISKLSGGLTNQSYFVKTKKNSYVCRFGPEKPYLLGLDKKREIYNTNQASELGIGPKVILYNKKYNMLVVSYIPGKFVSKKTIHDKSFIIKFAKELTVLHKSKRFKGIHDPWKLIKERLSFIKKSRNVLAKEVDSGYQMLKKLQKNIPVRNKVSSHVDLSYGNILINQDKISFIDWEYSAKADPCVDIAMASIELGWRISDEKLFLTHYVSKENISMKDVQVAKCLIALREASWGLIQSEIAHDKNDYPKYVRKCLKYFQKHIQKVVKSN